MVKIVGETGALRLTTDPAADRFPAWSPDGKRIAFLRFPKGAACGTIHVVSPLGGSERKLTDFSCAQSSVSWSPDGKYLAVTRAPNSSGNPDDAAGIYLLPIEKGEPRRITAPKAPERDVYPCFSPDGNSLAYCSYSGQLTANIYIRALDRGQVPQGKPRRITPEGSIIGGLAWARDGKSIIYSSYQTIVFAYLWRMPIDGSSPPQRLELAGPSAFRPCIAATGNRLAFDRWLTDPDIWRYRVGGKPESLILSSFWDANPQFSPDGRRIAFGSSRNGESVEIWTANADGSNPVQLTSRVGRVGSPQWSADGRWIAFDSQGEDGQFDIFAIESSGGRPSDYFGALERAQSQLVPGRPVDLLLIRPNGRTRNLASSGEWRPSGTGHDKRRELCPRVRKWRHAFLFQGNRRAFRQAACRGSGTTLDRLRLLGICSHTGRHLLLRPSR